MVRDRLNSSGVFGLCEVESLSDARRPSMPSEVIESSSAVPDPQVRRLVTEYEAPSALERNMVNGSKDGVSLVSAGSSRGDAHACERERGEETMNLTEGGRR